MEWSDGIAIAGVVVSAALSGLALFKSHQANAVAREAFKYSTAMVWMLVGYEEVVKTERLGIALPGDGHVHFWLSAVGEQAATQIEIEFSYDPNRLLAKPLKWPIYNPAKEEQIKIDSGLIGHDFASIQHAKDGFATVRWVDIAGKEREYRIPLNNMPFYTEDPEQVQITQS